MNRPVVRPDGGEGNVFPGRGALALAESPDPRTPRPGAARAPGRTRRMGPGLRTFLAPWAIAAALLLAAAESGGDPGLRLESGSVWLSGSTPRIRIEGASDAVGNLALHRIPEAAEFLRHRPEPGAAGLRSGDEVLAAALRDSGDDIARPGVQTPPWGRMEVVDTRPFRLAGDSPGAVSEVVYPGLAPGLYLARAVLPSESAVSLLLVSDLTLITRRAAEHLVVYAVERARGTPVSGARVIAWDRASRPREATTDDRGLAVLPTVDLGPEVRVVAEREGHVCAADTEAYPGGATAAPTLLGWADVPVGTNGGRVPISGVARGGRGEVRAALFDATGRRIGRADLAVSERGLFHGEIPIDDAPAQGLGWMTFTREECAAATGAEVRILPGAGEGLTLRLAGPGTPVVAGAPASIRLRAAYPSGGGPGGEAVYSVRRGPRAGGRHSRRDVRAFERVLEDAVALSADGAAEIAVPTRATAIPEIYVVRVTVRDPDTGRIVTGEAVFETVPAAVGVRVEMDRSFYATEDTARVTVIAEDPEGRPAQTLVRIRLSCDRPGTDVVLEGETGPSGRAVFEVPLVTPGWTRVDAWARDDRGRESMTHGRAWVVGDERSFRTPPAAIGIHPERTQYRVGESAAILVVLPVRGAHLLVTVEGEGVLWSEVFPTSGDRLVVPVPVLPAMAPAAAVRASFVWENRLWTGMSLLRVRPSAGLLEVSLALDKDDYRPGDDAHVTVRVRDARGEPVAGADVLVRAADADVLDSGPDLAPSVVEYFSPRSPAGVEPNSAMTLPGTSSVGEAGGIPVPRADAGTARTSAVTESPEPPDWPVEALRGHGSALLRTDGRGIVRAPIPLPGRVARWRVRAVVAGAGGEVGEAHVEMRTRTAVEMELDAPARLSVGDVAIARARVRHAGGEPATVELRLESEGPVAAAFEVGLPDGPRVGPPPTSAAVSLRAGEVRLVPIVLDARREGDFTWRLGARSPDGEEVRTLAGTVDGRTCDARSKSGRASESIQALSIDAPEDVSLDSARLLVQIAPDPLAALAQALEGLPAETEDGVLRALHGFVPHLHVLRLLEAEGIPHPRLERELERRVRRGLEQVRELRNADGGWGWRRGDATEAGWTARVVLDLADAEAQGAPVPADWRSGAIPVLRSALAGSPPARMRLRLLRALRAAGGGGRELLDRAPPVAAIDADRVALAEWVLLSAEAAGQVPEEAIQAWIARPAVVAETVEEILSEWTLAAQAQLRVEESAGGRAPSARVLRSLIDALVGTPPRTRGLAEAILAATRAAAAFRAGRRSGRVHLRLNDTAFPPLEVSATHLFGPSFLLEPPEGILRRGSNSLQISATEGLDTGFRVDLRTLGPPRPRREPAPDGGLDLRRDLFELSAAEDHEGRRWHRRPLGDSARLGSALVCALTIEAREPVDCLVIEDFLPAGSLPIDHAETPDGTGVRPPPAGTRFEVAGDRLIATLPALPAGRTVLEFAYRPGFAGGFRLPPAVARSALAPGRKAESSSIDLIIE